MENVDVSIVFPHQLYAEHPAIVPGRPVVVFECDLFFTQYKFHKHKLILHRASMKHFQDALERHGYLVYYLEFRSSSTEALVEFCKTHGFTRLHYCDPTDYLAERRLCRSAEKLRVALVKYNSPNFLCTPEYLHEYFGRAKRYRLSDFYIAQRKRLGILMNGAEPWGGKWTYDQDNRKRIPSKYTIPESFRFKESAFVSEARDYVGIHFSGNPGKGENFNYAIDYLQAKEGFRSFLEQSFVNYGVYQDAIRSSHATLFHSLLTPALNIGLLSPLEIIDESIAFAVNNSVPLNSLEGFIRQVIGWREFVRAVYLREGVRQRTTNFWKHSEPIPSCFWTGNTNVHPVDDSITKVLGHSYVHHIERLMVLGNFMLLCEFDPDEVYRWFMELFIDAYDWVMVPNVYGMSQFADGGIMSTKPYISGSNYIIKMSDYKKNQWSETWDALFWCFIRKHRQFFSGNPRLTMMVKQLDRMDESRIKRLSSVRADFIATLNSRP